MRTIIYGSADRLFPLLSGGTGLPPGEKPIPCKDCKGSGRVSSYEADKKLQASSLRGAFLTSGFQHNWCGPFYSGDGLESFSLLLSDLRMKYFNEIRKNEKKKINEEHKNKILQRGSWGGSSFHPSLVSDPACRTSCRFSKGVAES